MKSLDDMTEPELRALCNEVADAINDILPEGTGFILLFAPFGKSGVAQYVANGTRPECIAWLKETADRLEGRDDVSR